MIKLMLGDARNVLRATADESVDLIVSDVPYPCISGGNKGVGRPTGMLAANDGKNFDHNDVKPEDYVADMFRVLRDGSHCYIMVNMLNLFHYRNVFVSAGFRLHNLLVWQKQNATPNRWYMKNCEYVLFFRKGPPRTINLPGSMTCHAFRNPTGNKSHPTEKPLELMQFYIENSSDPGDVVMDPFMGSGATGVAAAALGRSFVGCEIDPKYYTIACLRMGVMP